MLRFGLLGYPLSHSFSKKYFTKKFETQEIQATYENIELKNLMNFKEKILTKSLQGFNVTIPYKTEIIPFLDEISSEAKRIGAVNTVKIAGNKLIGYNTDVFGFEHSLLPLIKKMNNTKALILGNGGAAKAVKFVLEKLNIPFLVITRNPNGNLMTFEEIDEAIINEHKLIINCTPLGMSPNIESKANIPYQYLSESHVLYDLVYNPEETKFLAAGNNRGAQTKNGLEMLQLQAEKSWEIWTNNP